MSSSQVAKSYSARHNSVYHAGSNVGNMSRRRSDVDTGDFFKVIEIPFSPFQNDYGVGDDEDFNFAVSTRVSSRGGGHGDPLGSRQEFLRSYTFSRATKQTVYEKMKSNLLRLRAAAWAVVACNYPRLRNPTRTIKRVGKSSLTTFRPSHLLCGSSHHQSTSGSRKSKSRPVLPHCFGL